MAFLGRGRSVDDLVGDLHSSSAESRYVAAGELGGLGSAAAPAIPVLVALLGDEETVVRRTEFAGESGYRNMEYSVGGAAADALADIGMESVPALIESLESGSEEARANALEALRDISGATELGPTAAEWRRWQDRQGGGSR